MQFKNIKMQKDLTAKEQRERNQKMFKCKRVGLQKSRKKMTKRLTIRLNQDEGVLGKRKISVHTTYNYYYYYYDQTQKDV